jgi:hypothetical protein
MSHPAVDLLTDHAAVVLQERGTVPFTSWLADAVRLCAESERGLQVVTPPDASITVPLRLALGPPPYRWVVRAPEGPYDGLTGATLTWDGTHYVAIKDEEGAGSFAPAYTRTPSPLGSQLILTLEVRHPAAEATVLGGAAELLTQALAGSPPAGWGTAEPVTQLWNRAELTTMCRELAPRPVWLVFTAAPATGASRTIIGTLRISRVMTGVSEETKLFVGYASDEDPPIDGLGEIVSGLTSGQALVSMLVQRVAGPADLTVIPHFVGLPAPVGLAVGPDGVRSIGTERALHPPGLAADAVGGPNAPAVWYPLGDGLSPESHRRFHRLMGHLEPGSGAAPF